MNPIEIGPGDYSLRQLSHFVAVAECGTISAAAERLYMSPSALSGSITELERVLGAELCVRRRAQGVTLTPLGRQVLEKARQLLADAAELTYMVRGGGAELAGPLGIGCFVTLAPTVLPRLLSEMESAHPKVTLDFLEGSQDVLHEALLKGRIDVAVMYDMGGLEGLDTILLYEACGYALVGEDHPLAQQPTVTLEDLAPEPLVLFDQPPSTNYAMSAFDARGLVPHIRHRTQSYELTRSIVARGRTYAILVQRPPNKSSYEGLPLIEREVVPPLPAVPVVLAWPSDVRLSPRARALAELTRRLYAHRRT
ncbi:LysR family transcriptional regulator [Geodermatophilus ruber]|uniref:DNA-binding transcriptional regulator, LysR family n=1 Tax=Geodermatophilus ruber TaxID=504800 RepID=A0A1I4GJB7_9ACTN|nr:LysR family transcriptional regulator [Geodermatophilus ruber]SFL29417.1 DNA-binding transcriptional regulator, LysR family [Geodermatophilus ruber]